VPTTGWFEGSASFFVPVIEIVELLLDVGEDEHGPAVVDRPKYSCRGIGPLHLAWRKRAVIIMKLVQGKAQLPQIIAAGKPVGGFAHLLRRRNNRPIKTAMMAITTSNSIRVKPLRVGGNGALHAPSVAFVRRLVP